MTLSKDWILKGPLKNTENPDMSVIETAQTHSKSTINSEAIGGWCPVDCSTQFKIFGITMFLLGVLGTALEILKCESVFLYNIGRLNNFIGQKCLKLKLRSAFVPM